MNKVGLYLLNKKGYIVLEDLISEKKYDQVAFVVIGRDVKLDNDYSVEIKRVCEENNIHYYYRGDSIEERVEYIFTIGWRWIIKSDAKIIVLHDSLLPKYRGFAPLVNALINKEKYIGVTALFGTENYDDGEVIEQLAEEIIYPIKIKEAIDIVSKLYSKIVLNILTRISKNAKINSYKQDKSNITYSLWRDKDDYYINWGWEADKIKRFVDAVGLPYEGAHTVLENEIIIVEEVEIYEDVFVENRNVGKVIFIEEGYPVVVCGDGLIKITQANYKKSQISILPIKKFRSKFRSYIPYN